ncbi:magnesium transporter CorA family protein [Nitrosopumilus sp. K4]|uniref:magnesium transporter CorA family protein n=1 Tax=Nitrosopumilus sp. K4 TaxID=2795383 RepID=UPI001BAB71E6|nr:magnesium transporter CorA family protein [Nitrosopumilus sp. K4]QUC64238.1 magnesium transporter CorA family protein [Nitrosopumilus sp. K4]
MKRSIIPNRLRSGKKSQEQTVGKSVERIQGNEFTWIDIQNPDRWVIEELAQEFNLNALNIEDCLAKFELPKLDAYDDHFFLILHFPPLFSKIAVPQVSQLSVFMGKNFLITIHQGDLQPLVDIVKTCKESEDNQRREQLLGESSGALLHEIIDVLVDDMLHTLRRIMANLVGIEEGVFDEKKSVARQISRLRKEITILRRISNPLKRLVLETGKQVQRFIPTDEDDLKLYFDDVIDHLDRIIESLEESRETMEIYKDTDFVISTEKTNKVLAVLTMIFTLAIPATIIGTFYGMNIALPGGIDEDSSMLFGTYTTFIIIILASIIPAGLMFAYFKKSGWLG